MNKLWVLALLAAASGVASAQVPVFGTTVDAKTGFTYQGAAPSTHTLCGNGTVYVDSATPCATIFYQTVDANSVPQTQRSVLNFSVFFGLADVSGATLVDAAQVGANKTCANPSTMTVDVYGRTTACTAGTPIPVHAAIVGGGCVTGADSFDFCDNTITFPSGDFPNASTTAVSCNGLGPSDPRAMMSVESKSFSAGVLTVVCRTTGLGSVALNFGEIDVIAVNN